MILLVGESRLRRDIIASDFLFEVGLRTILLFTGKSVLLKSMEWRRRRQLIFFGIPAAVVLVILIFIVASFFRINGGETKVEKIEDIRVLWARPLPIRPGLVDVAALAENPNIDKAVEEFRYLIKIYDESDILIALREGSSFAYPGERFVIFESGISVQERFAHRAVLEIRSARWHESSFYLSPITVLKTERFLNESPAHLSLLLSNSSFENLLDQEVAIVLRGADGTAIAASRTLVDEFVSGARRMVFFSWPQAFSQDSTDIAIDIFIRPQEFVAR